MPWKYIGDGSWLAGVPARDLEDDGEDAERVKEWEEREGVTLDKSGLYTREKATKGGAKPADSEGE